MRSIATVATGPCAIRAAMMPPAISIWLNTHPPKICPLLLMSAMRGTTRNTTSPLWSVIVGNLVFHAVDDLFVLSRSAGQKCQGHQSRPQHARQPAIGRASRRESVVHKV